MVRPKEGQLGWDLFSGFGVEELAKSIQILRYMFNQVLHGSYIFLMILFNGLRMLKVSHALQIHMPRATLRGKSAPKTGCATPRPRAA